MYTGIRVHEPILVPPAADDLINEIFICIDNSDMANAYYVFPHSYRPQVLNSLYNYNISNYDEHDLSTNDPLSGMYQIDVFVSPSVAIVPYTFIHL